MSDETALRAAYALHQAGRFEEAAATYAAIIEGNPQNLDASILLGVLCLQGGRFQKAEHILGEAVKHNPHSVDALSAYAAALQQLKRHDEAIAALDSLLAVRPDHAVAWNNRGNMLLETGCIDDAVQSYDRAVELRPDYAEAWHNRAVARIMVANYGGAEADLDRALLFKPDYAEALEHRGVVLAQLGRLDEAFTSYAAALRSQPDYYEALKGRGYLLNRLERYADALVDFDRALSISRDDAAVWKGRGDALASLNHDEQALASYNEVLRLQSDDAATLYNRASLLSRLARYEDAGRDLEALLAIDPQYPLARGLLMHVRLHMCDWRGLTEYQQEISLALHAGQRVIHPFGHLAISDSPAEQLQCARILVRDSYPLAPIPLSRSEIYPHEKLRIAYLSGDYYAHAIPFLIAGVFEHHDPARFETFGVSYGPTDNSEMRMRLENGFIRFIDVRDKNDAEIAAMLREMEVDIAVDLKGYTGGARPGILARRPAPIQVHYLGYPGTMGADYIDYLIADRVVVPQEHHEFYAEKIVYLPDSYQANDSQRRIATRSVTRAAASLPQDAFVFCCFNGNHKIMPETFRIWMRILSQVHGSVLWLLEEHPSAIVNLRNEAQAAGIAPDRVVFAKRMSLEDHLARLKLADLVLDTLPYGAHTTASDALWAGVPVLTRQGDAFAGRVGASLLNAIGLPELITHSLADYEMKARELSQNASLLAGIREELAGNRQTMPLFDTARMTRNLEAAYSEMWERHRRGERPASFALGAAPE